jgi:hypothetical protein
LGVGMEEPALARNRRIERVFSPTRRGSAYTWY